MDYLPIEKETILPDTVNSFDIFFKTGDDMKLFCSAGKEIDNDVMEKYEKNDTQELYILKKDKNYYFLYLEEILGSILNTNEISMEVKAKTAYDTVQNLAELLFKSPKAELIQRYKNTVIDIKDFIFRASGGALILFRKEI